MSKIEWTEATWNPFVGCSLVSPGCTHCYAMTMAARLAAMSNGHEQRSGTGEPGPLAHYRGLTQPSKAGPVWSGKVTLAPEAKLLEPLRRKKPTMYFVNSMSDLFHESVPDEWIDRVFAVMALTPQHTFQVLTKRSARMRNYVAHLYETDEGIERLCDAAVAVSGSPCAAHIEDVTPPLPNVWLGVSCEDQRRADERIPDLLATPAAVRFVSAEPLLGPIELRPCWLERMTVCDTCPKGCAVDGATINCECAKERLDWIIVGGESGNDARPMHPDWARSIRDQCEAAGVAFFFKQWGAWTPGENVERRTGSVKVAYSDGDEPWTFGSELMEFDGGHIDDEPTVYCVGKREAGRHLDGREWNEMPATHPAREVAV